MSRTVSWLEDGGFVETRLSAGASRYRAPIALTDKGARVTAEVDQSINDVVEAASKGISESDRVAMRRALTAIRENLRGIVEKEGEE